MAGSAYALAVSACFAGAVCFFAAPDFALAFLAVFLDVGLAVLWAAQRAFCAAAILALPSGLIVRLPFFARTGTAALVACLTEPLGRPRFLPAGELLLSFPVSKARACCKFVIC